MLIMVILYELKFILCIFAMGYSIIYRDLRHPKISISHSTTNNYTYARTCILFQYCYDAFGISSCSGFYTTINIRTSS